MKRTANELIYQLVERVNESPREPLHEFEISPSVRVSAVNDELFGEWNWKIKTHENINWVEDLEMRLPARFPASFRALITHYIFPRFEIGPLEIFGNTPEAKDSRWDLRTGIFNDKFLSKTLLDGGFIQFARPCCGSYDPICFDTNRKNTDGEFPVVMLDHECALDYQINIIELVGASFREIVERHLHRSADDH